MFPKIEKLCRIFESECDLISKERKEILKSTAAMIASEIDSGRKAKLIYICTHNSRRSHFGQVWVNVVAEFYGLSSKLKRFLVGPK
jgi:protein-tyrosine phosphatase/arsenate reductase